MFKKKKENEKHVQLYFYYRKIQRIILAVSIFVNIVFVSFVMSEGNLGVFLIFGLNLYVAGWAYWEFMRKQKKEKEKNPIVK